MTVAFHMGSSFIQKTPIYCCVFDVISMGHMRVTLEARTLWPPLEMLMGSEHTDWLHWHKRANNATHPWSVLVLGPKKHCSATRMGVSTAENSFSPVWRSHVTAIIWVSGRFWSAHWGQSGGEWSRKEEVDSQ